MAWKWVSSLAWVALAVFVTANSLAVAHTCLHVCSCHHEHAIDSPADEAADACCCPDQHHDADHSSCPCENENPHPNKPYCPHGCPTCNLVQTPSIVPVESLLEPAACVGHSLCEIPIVYLAPYHGQLIRPPRA